MVWLGMAWYCLVEILKLHIGWGLPNGEVICGFREVIWVDGFKIRWVDRTDGWVGQVGWYVRWLGSSGGSGK